MKRLLVAALILILILPVSAWAMTEAELLTALGAKYSKVGEPSASSRRGDNPIEVGGINYTEKEVWACDQLADGALRCSLVRYRVSDAGEAFWADAAPKPPAGPLSLTEALQARITEHISSGVIKNATILSLNEKDNRAEVEVVGGPAGGVTFPEDVRKRVLAIRTGTTTFTFTVIQ